MSLFLKVIFFSSADNEAGIVKSEGFLQRLPRKYQKVRKTSYYIQNSSRKEEYEANAKERKCQTRTNDEMGKN